MPQGPRSKPQTFCQAIGYHHQTSVIFPGHRFRESNRFHVPRQQGTRIQADVMFTGHMIPQSNMSHIPRPMLSRIKPQSYSQARGFHHQTSVLLPGQGSTIKPQSCCQATGFQKQASVMLPGHRVPPSHLSHIPRPQVSRIKPISFSQATAYQNPNRCHVHRPQDSTI